MGHSEADSAGDELLTTGQAANVLGTSRQHVVDLCASGRLPYQLTGVHRRVRRGDVEEIRSRQGRLTRDESRSLWLHRAVAGKLVLDPKRAMDQARLNLAKLREVHSYGHVRTAFDAWQSLLDGPLDVLLDLLVSKSPRAFELRQNTPFAGVLSQAERDAALATFSHTRNAA